MRSVELLTPGRITYQTRRRVTRSADDAFEVLGIHAYDNHPRPIPDRRV